MYWISIFLGAIALFLCYLTLIRPYKYWTARGVNQGQGLPVPVLGDMFGNIFGLETMSEMTVSVYNKAPKERYSGMYLFFIPVLVLRDPDLIKEITVKVFDHFLDHASVLEEGSDPLWTKNLVALKGENWREMRSILSPAFTGSKMRFMFPLIVKTTETFVKYFLEKTDEVAVVEMKDIFTRFTNDVIANTAFGVDDVDSLKNPCNDFYLMGKQATEFGGFWRQLKLLGFVFFPRLYKFLDVRMFPPKVADFFTNLVKKNIESRMRHGVVRPDMIQLLLEGRNSKEISDQDIASQAFVFFFAGFDSVSGLMCFMSYELAVNQDIQKRLYQEIAQTLQECGGKITYEALLNMKYLDMVILETLRKWPNSPSGDRVCTKPYTIQPKRPGELPVHLQKGNAIWLPIFAIHRDPEYYPEPENFVPERFSEENKHKINPYTYLPFGSGPRNCIGSRFALLETKALFFQVLAEFEIVPVEKTQIPIKISRKQFTLAAEGGFWMGLKKRRKN